MRFLGRLFRVLAGFLIACVIAALVSSLFIDTPAELVRIPVGEFAAKGTGGLEHVLLVATHYAIFSAAFALIIAGLAEWLSLRTVTYAVGAGMGIALLGLIAQYWSEFADQPTIFNTYALATFLTSGFFAGFAYWVIAGRYAGPHVEPASREAAVAAGSKGGNEAARGRVIVDKASGEPRKGSLAEKLAQKRAVVASAAKTVTTAVPITKPTADAGPAAPDPKGAVSAAKEAAQEPVKDGVKRPPPAAPAPTNPTGSGQGSSAVPAAASPPADATLEPKKA